MSVQKNLMVLLLVLFSGKALGYEFPIEVTEYIDDVKVVVYINKSDISHEAKWIPFEHSPPLSIGDALQAVEKYVNSRNDFSALELTGIELKKIPHHEAHWHYLVKTNVKVSDKVQAHFFVVLMDGKVISALKEPDSIK